MLKFQFFYYFLVFVKSGQTMVKLLIQEVLLLLKNYSRILVLLNNYFGFFEFWTNLICHVCRRPGSSCRSTSGDWRRDDERRSREALVASC